MIRKEPIEITGHENREGLPSRTVQQRILPHYPGWAAVGPGVAVDVQTRELDDVDLGRQSQDHHRRPADVEPKLALTIGREAYARPHPDPDRWRGDRPRRSAGHGYGPAAAYGVPSLIFFTATVRLANRAPAGCSCPASKVFYERRRAEGKLHTEAVLALARRRVTTASGLPTGPRFRAPEQATG